MIVALALLSAGVTFKETATLDHLLKDLAVQCGQPMHAVGKLKGEVLLVDVHDADLERLCGNIAKALDAEWDRSEKDWKLLRSPGLERRLAAQERERKLAGWKISQAKMREELAKAPAFDAKEASALWGDYEAWYRRYPDYGGLTNEQRNGAIAQWERMMTRSPGNRALRQMIATMDLSLAAELGDSDRIVFAQPPNRMQAPLKGAGDKLMEDLDGMLRTWKAEADQRGKPKRAYIYNGDPTYDEYRMDGRRLVVLSSRENGQELIFQLWQYNQSGENLRESIDWLVDEGFYTEPQREGDQKPFVADAVTDAWFQSLKSPLSEAGKEKFSRPDKYEPLGFVLGPDLSQIAKRRQRDIVAVLPDKAAITPPFIRYRKYSDSQYLWILAGMGVKVDDDGQTMVLRNQYPLALQADRSDRTDLTNFISSVVKDGRVGLEPLASFVARNPYLGYDYIGRTASEFLVPGSTAGQANTDERLLRLYGLLDVDQRKVLGAGGSVRLDTLSPRQKSVVENMVFFSDRVPQMTMRDMASGQAVKGVRTILDTTELLPAGLTPDSRLKIQVDGDLAVMTVGKVNGKSYSSVQDLDDMIQNALMPSRVGGWPAYRDRIPGWATANRRRLRFVFQLSPTISFDRELTDVAMPKAKDAVAYDQLPVAVRKQIEAAMVSEAKKRAEWGVSGKKPPP